MASSSAVRLPSGLEHLAPAFERAGGAALLALLALDNVNLRELGAACIEVAAVRSALGLAGVTAGHVGHATSCQPSIPLPLRLASRGQPAQAENASNFSGGMGGSKKQQKSRGDSGGSGQSGAIASLGKRPAAMAETNHTHALSGAGLASVGESRDSGAAASGKRVTRQSRDSDLKQSVAELITMRVKLALTHIPASVSFGAGGCIEGGMEIGDAGARVLAPAVSALVSLSLASNKIGQQGLQWIAKSVSLSTTLTSLDLFNNPFADEGATFLAEALRHNMSITRLNIRGCDVDLEGLTELAAAVDVNKTLLFFDLNDVVRFRSNHRNIKIKAKSLDVSLIKEELRVRELNTEGLKDVLARRLQDVLDMYTPQLASIKKSLARNMRLLLENKLTAFAMGMHPRLGKNIKCAVHKLNEEGILRVIANQLFKE